MSEAKYTPGPWVVDMTNAFGVYGVWTDYATHPGHDGAGYGSQICDMLTVSFPQTDKASRPERDANARLISAAPDLLAAVKYFIRVCDANGFCKSGKGSTDSAELAAARDAVAKAEGGAK